MACYWLNQHGTEIAISDADEIGGVVYYRIVVKVDAVQWTVVHRYSEFYGLHQQLVADHGIGREHLPPKKILGNRAADFVDGRRVQLAAYLQTVTKYLQLRMPWVLIEFLDFHIYDIFFLLQSMAFNFYREADTILASSTLVYIMNPLQMHAISECCKIPFPEREDCDKQHDLSHTFDFCSQLKKVVINGKADQYILSNIIPNKLPFEFSSFKSLTCLKLCDLPVENIYGLGNLRSKLKTLIVNNCGLTQIAQILQCDVLHKSLEDEHQWKLLDKLDLGNNNLRGIDASIKLLPNVTTLILNNNHIDCISNLSTLTKLRHLSLENNVVCGAGGVALDEELANVATLDLTNNAVSSLAGFAQVRSLLILNLSSNRLNDIEEVANLAQLRQLSELTLTGNSLAVYIDYRIKVFEHFPDEQLSRISLDNEAPSQQERDKVSLMRALRIVKEGKMPDFYK